MHFVRRFGLAEHVDRVGDEKRVNKIDGMIAYHKSVAPATAALARQGQMMEAFETCFGPYPFAGYTVVVVMINQPVPYGRVTGTVIDAGPAYPGSERNATVPVSRTSGAPSPDERTRTPSSRSRPASARA